MQGFDVNVKQLCLHYSMHHTLDHIPDLGSGSYYNEDTILSVTPKFRQGTDCLAVFGNYGRLFFFF